MKQLTSRDMPYQITLNLSATARCQLADIFNRCALDPAYAGDTYEHLLHQGLSMMYEKIMNGGKK